MAGEAATQATANGWAKDLFTETTDLRPETGLTFTRRVKFDNKNKLGDEIKDHVWLTDEAGFTYHSGTGVDHDLNDPVAAESQQTNISGVEITLVSHVATKLLSTSMNGGKSSFGRYWAGHLANMRKSFNKRVEMATKYGGSSLGKLGATATDGGTTVTLPISLATFAPGFWIGAKNARMDAYDGAALLNTRAELKVATVNLKTRTLTATGNADDIDGIVAAGTAVELYWKGSYGQTGTGARTVANLSTGSYVGISADTYGDVWAGTQIDCESEPLSWSRIADGLSEAASRGCEGRLILEVSQRGWSQLAIDINALRTIDASYDKKKTDIGTEGIRFRWHTGEVEVVPSNYTKYGDAIAFPDPGGEDGADVRRIGSTDITFMNPDKGGEMFTQVAGKNSVEVRAYSDQQYYTKQVRDHILWHTIG